MKVGIVGVGVVGSAMLQAFTDKGIDTVGYDKFVPTYVSNWELIPTCDVVFSCLPTKTYGAEQQLSPLISTLELLVASKFRGVFVVKSTVLPGTTAALQRGYPTLRIVHNPEFLTAANPLADFLKQPAILIGGESRDTGDVAAVYRRFDDQIPIHVAHSGTSTEVAKYVHNTFLATKVSFFNEVHLMCEHLGVVYADMMEGVHAIGQVGRGHCKVPGPDGGLGFGGMCFVKDTQALDAWSKPQDIKLRVMSAAIETNKLLRPGAYDGTEDTGYLPEVK